MKTRLIEDSEDLIRLLNEYPNHYAFRGHADAEWELESALERMLRGDAFARQALTFETRSLNSFRSKFTVYNVIEAEPGSTLGWLALMQHYGVPTRMLDFTESPYVALYFALEAYRPNLHKDMAIYAIDYTDLMNASISEISGVDPLFGETRESIQTKTDEVFDRVSVDNLPCVLWMTEPARLNVRIDRQAGTFLVPTNLRRRIKDLVDTAPYKNCKIEKIVIRSDLYPNIFSLLRKMNITGKAIYGDLNGLAQSIRMEMQVYST